MGQRKRTPRKPKARSRHRRGGDRVSVKAKTEQAQRDAQSFQMRAQGFSFATISGVLGIGEEACRLGYWRAVRFQSLATIEESRALALSDIDQRRAIIWTEIRKRQAAFGTDAKKRFDVRELHALMAALHLCAVRQARLQGLDAPSRLGIAWMGEPVGGDALTNEMLNRLSVDELRALFALLEKARNGASIEAESRPVQAALNIPPPAPPTDPQHTPVEQHAPVEAQPPAPAQEDLESRARRESDERFAPLIEAEELIERLNSSDPLVAIADPLQRAEMARKVNAILVRYGRPLWTEWRGN